MKKINIQAVLIIVLSITFLNSCNKSETTISPTLYERVGGMTMVSDPTKSGVMIEKGRLTLRSVVDSSILVIAADPAMTKFFPVLFAELGAGNTTGLAMLSKNFADFLCIATKAKNFSYSGLNMKDAHDPAKNSRIADKITSAEFDKFVGDIGVGLAQNGVTVQNNAALVNDLVALLNTTKGEIVQK